MFRASHEVFEMRHAKIDMFMCYFDKIDSTTHSYIKLTILDLIMANLKHFPENTLCIKCLWATGN